MSPVKFNKPESEAIKAAHNAIRYLCATTNWTDAPQFKRAYKLSRKDSDSQVEAMGRNVKAWRAGVRALTADCPISNYPFGYTESYRLAFDLGATQCIKHSGPNRSDYTGPHYDSAVALLDSAVDAFEAAMMRWHDVPIADRMAN